MLRNKLYVYGDENVEVPMHLHLGKAMLDNMISYGDIVALINADTGEKLTYRELAQRAVNIALSLARIGVGKGQVVSICSEKRFEVIITMIGVICTGATLSSTDVTAGRMTLLHRVAIAKPKIMFCSASAYDTHKESLQSTGYIDKYIVYGDERKDGAVLLKDFVTEHAEVEDFLPAPVDGWVDKLIILFSSGTTGLPKGIPLTHLSFLLNSTQLIYDSYKGKPVFITREWYYSYGQMYTLGCLRAGATVVFSPRNELEDYLKAIQTYKIKMIQLAPATVVELIKCAKLREYDVSSVEHVISSSTPIKSDQIETAKKRLPNLKYIFQIYGLSEAGAVCNDMFAPQGPRSGSAGVPSTGFILKVVNLKTREPLGPNQRGEICLKSTSLMPGYLGDIAMDYMDEEGFFKTGDVGYYDEDGYFFIVDRIKDLIKFNSYQVSPAELEAVLLQHSAVHEAGVVGAPHAEYGQVPTAFVVLQPGADVTGDELVAYVDTQVSYRMRLAGGVRFVAKLPRAGGIKIDRKELKLLL